jgi:two-component system OmpR family sensor kinase
VKVTFGKLSGALVSFLHSIRFRLTLWFILILAVVLAAFSGFIYFAQTRDLRGDAVGRMQEKYVRVQQYFRSPELQLSGLSPDSVPGGDLPLQKGDLLMLLGSDSSVLQSWGESIAQPTVILRQLVVAGAGQQALSVFERPVPIVNAGNQVISTDYLFIITPVFRDGQLLGYLVIGSPSDLLSQQHRLALSLVLGSLGMLVVAFLGGLWLADRAMRPVAAIARAARTISETDLGRRLNLPGRDELTDLAATIDAMLARLESAFERQRRFVADASHELRTPLTIINLEAGRALSTPRRAEEYQRALGVVDAEAARMTRLVNDLLTLARMDSGQAALQLDELDLSDVALEAVERMEPLAREKRITLHTDDLPEVAVRGDRQYLLQMLSNLLENGIKYCSAGQSIRVRTSVDGRRGLLSVADDGPGIQAEHLPALFERFYRADAARTHSEDEASPSSGSGLGLSIVAWIVHAHGGTIAVKSDVGKGTTFDVTLPLSESS